MTGPSDTPATPEITIAEITELIAEFEKYRERLISEADDVSQKTENSKEETLARLKPELTKVDAALTQLRAQLTTLTPGEPS